MIDSSVFCDKVVDKVRIKSRIVFFYFKDGSTASVIHDGECLDVIFSRDESIDVVSLTEQD
jgi:hypothetical protein